LTSERGIERRGKVEALIARRKRDRNVVNSERALDCRLKGATGRVARERKSISLNIRKRLSADPEKRREAHTMWVLDGGFG